MLTSEPCLELLQALLAARLAFPPITRNCKAWSPKSKKTYPYADQNAIIDVVVPVLGAHGVLLMQAPEDGEPGLISLTTTLFHVASGQWMRSILSFERLSNPQDAGSQITYYKRYGLAGILSLSTETDDDASSLNGHKPEKPAAVEHPRPSVASHGTGDAPTTAPEPDAGLEHPTLAHLDALMELVTVQCGADIEELQGRIRKTLGLRPDASTTPRLMVRVMTMAQYMTIFAHFTTVAEQLERSRRQEAPHADDSTPHPTPEPAPAPTEAPAGETPSVDPQRAASETTGAVESSSAPEPDAAERDRVRLRAEVAQWDLRVPPEEVEHVIQHNPYSRARALLWKCRRQDTAA